MPEGTGGRFVRLLDYKVRQFPLIDAPARSVGPVLTNIEQLFIPTGGRLK
jgi:hypothetical protein